MFWRLRCCKEEASGTVSTREPSICSSTPRSPKKASAGYLPTLSRAYTKYLSLHKYSVLGT